MTSNRRKLGTALALPLTLALGAGVASAQSPGSEVDTPDSFDVEWRVEATPDQVAIEDGERGNPDASAVYDLRINVAEEIICFDVTAQGISGDWESPAPTANHIHRGTVGTVGPPVVILPDLEPGPGGDLTTSGCLQEPFAPDADISSLQEIVDNPAQHYLDVHTAEFPRGDVRGNLQQRTAIGDTDEPAAAMPAPGAGPDAGFGGAAVEDRTVALTAAVAMLALAGAATATSLAGRRRATEPA